MTGYSKLWAQHRLHEMAQQIAERNARICRRADSASDIAMAIVLGVLGAVVLMHWAGWLL